MKRETVSIITHEVTGLTLGAFFALLIAIKFAYLYTPGDADQMTQKGVAETKAGICYAQFTKDPNYQADLKQLKATDPKDRDAFIQKGGWDKMPGEDSATEGVADVCGDRLSSLVGS